MGSDATAVREMLEAAETAHGTYERDELNGVYDADWARWYAGYLVDHGLGDVLGRPVTVDGLAQDLVDGFAEHERSPVAGESWSEAIARRLTSSR
jgi:hypothetical protein